MVHNVLRPDRSGERSTLVVVSSIGLMVLAAVILQQVNAPKEAIGPAIAAAGTIAPDAALRWQRRRQATPGPGTSDAAPQPPSRYYCNLLSLRAAALLALADAAATIWALGLIRFLGHDFYTYQEGYLVPDEQRLYFITNLVALPFFLGLAVWVFVSVYHRIVGLNVRWVVATSLLYFALVTVINRITEDLSKLPPFSRFGYEVGFQMLFVFGTVVAAGVAYTWSHRRRSGLKSVV